MVVVVVTVGGSLRCKGIMDVNGGGSSRRGEISRSDRKGRLLMQPRLGINNRAGRSSWTRIIAESPPSLVCARKNCGENAFPACGFSCCEISSEQLAWLYSRRSLKFTEVGRWKGSERGSKINNGHLRQLRSCI